jgi:DNA-binding SARP family transcriptional activator/predicted ATPase
MGVPEVTLDGARITFSRRRAFALLVYLAVTGHAHTRDVLGTLLSGEAAESQARKRLSNALAELRQLVGDYVITTRETAAFNSGLPFWIDVHAFRDALVTGMGTEGIDGLESALDLYHEEFLSGLIVSEASGFDEWVMLQGEALRTQAVQALQALVTRAMRMKEDAQGVSAARRLVALEPLLEDAHRQLMALLARVGQRQEALAQYEICRSILEHELGEQPSPETIDLYHRLKLARVTLPQGLPTPDAPCVARDRELNLLESRLVEPECRFITLVGLSGSGKTRLALEAAHALAGSPLPSEQPFPDGVFFVSLDGDCSSAAPPVRTYRDMVDRVTEVLGLDIDIGASHPTDTADQLLATLKARRLLLVLDGMDVLPPRDAAESVRLLLDCAQVTLLVTAPRALRLPGEHVLAVGQLDLPGRPEEVDHAPASSMLLAEAQRHRLDFVLCDDDRAHIVTLCKLTGGMPLALKLLAQWMPRLALPDMIAELERDLGLLCTDDPAVRPEHRSIGTLLARTWEHLSEPQQDIVRRLSVFQGSFDRTAAEEVAGCRVQHITMLIDAGLLTQCEETRYRLHELVRRHAAQELAGRPQEEAEARERYAWYVVRLMPGAAEEARPDRPAARARRIERQDLRSAWSWATAQHAWDLLRRLSEAFLRYPLLPELMEGDVAALEAAIDSVRLAVDTRDQVTPDLQLLLVTLLSLEVSTLEAMARHDQAEGILTEAAARASQADPRGSQHGKRAALVALGQAHYQLGYVDEAAATYAELLEMDRLHGDRRQVIESTSDLAGASLAGGNKLRAAALLDSILSDLLRGNTAANPYPARAYLTAYEILHAIGDHRDARLLGIGRQLLLEQQRDLPEEVRPLLLVQRVATNRVPARAHDEGVFHHESVTHVGIHGAT